MTKNTKIAAIVSAAALLAIGASMTSFAATGWQEEDGTWVYYDRYQERVTDKWEKSGNNWYYLNRDGEMSTDELIEYSDNYYYVDANGAMVTNQWVEMDNSDDDDENAASTVWYYFQNNGKAFKAPSSGKTTFHTINGKKYAFDEDGKMLWGWVDTQSTRQNGEDDWMSTDDMYYLGGSDDGAQMYNSWGYLHVVDNTDTDDDADQDRWFYFGSNGKAYKNDKAYGYYEKTINGKKYTFDEYGRMLYEFVASGAKGDKEGTASVAEHGVRYYRTAEDGAKYTKGWFRVVPDKMFDYPDSEEEDDTARWFYADGQGNFYNSKIKSINGKKYAFDSDGEMLGGLRYLEFNTSGEIITISDEIDDVDKLDHYTSTDTNKFDDDTADTVSGIYYSDDENEKDGVYAFGDEETDGSMKTGTQTLTIDGDSYTFKLKSSGSAKGRGVQGKDSKAYYVNGRKVKADSDDKYSIYLYDDSTKAVTKASTKDLYEDQFDSGNGGHIYYKSNTSYEIKARGYGYYTDETTPSPVFVPEDGDQTYVLISSSGQWVTAGTKKDGDDYKIKVKGEQIIGIYREE